MSESLADYAAAHFRAEMGRRGISKRELANRMGVSDMWVGRRMRGLTRLTMDDIERISVELDIPAAGFIPATERVA